ncbi:hypothetical protein PS2_002 [Serratia phage PS2]|uniref:Uncharacterized protein n=1 Tax=Serratia phage PS2 TaxID=1481112 RepID=A0A023W4K8_9CAUD|nr:hypothetical protein FF83_gp002 [Serratia phage PS2]AHY25254.1 hypothetical protein PS2_002 [Serratia phage PS2]
MNDIIVVLRSVIRTALPGIMGDEVRTTSKFMDVELGRELKKFFSDILYKIDQSKDLEEKEILALVKLLETSPEWRNQHFVTVNPYDLMRNLFNENA